jgi:hypothetical protein
MRKLLRIEEENLLLINFDEVFKDIEINCLNELQEYGLLENFKIDLSKRDTKKILYHHIILGLCEEIRLNKDSNKKIVIIPPKIREFHEISQFCNLEELEPIINTLLKKLQRYLPFTMFFSEEYIFDKELEHSGERTDLINILSAMYTTNSDKKFTFEKIKKFTSQYELEFLSLEYFNSIKTKLILH